ncbi:MAG: choice-of-anchor V domain-containing protein [Candidatus Binatia bacterium]
MHTHGWPVAAAILLAGGLLPAAAAAHSTGETGHSGKQGAICNQRHSGGTAPTVAFDGPTAVAPGDSATYTFTVASARAAQRAAGFNVAASAGALATVANQGEQLIGGELTHTAPGTTSTAPRAGASPGRRRRAPARRCCTAPATASTATGRALATAPPPPRSR